MESKRTPAIRINFLKSPDHKTYPVSGVWGSATPQGDLHCNFYIEHLNIPESFEIEMDMVSNKATEKMAPDEKVYTREILASFVLKPEIAMSIGKWMIQKAEMITRSRKLAAQEPRGTLQ